MEKDYHTRLSRLGFTKMKLANLGLACPTVKRTERYMHSNQLYELDNPS